MKDILKPIMDLEEYPSGFLLLHEENLTLAQTYDLPSRFLYAIQPKTMDYIEAVYDQEGKVPLDALILGDNKVIRLKGADTIGVLLEYSDRRVYLLNSTSHGDVLGSSATCYQVAAGLHATLLTLRAPPFPPSPFRRGSLRHPFECLNG